MADGDVKWYGNRVRGLIEDATMEAIKKIAFDIEALTKLNITNNGQVDTGFMRNSVYAQTKDGDHGGMLSGDMPDREGRLVWRETAEMAGLSDADAVVGVGAVYAIYQEMRREFFKPAFEQVIVNAGGTVHQEFQKKGF